MYTLYSRFKEGITLKDALEAAKNAIGPNAVALLYSYQVCHVAKLAGTEFKVSNNEAIDLNSVFEARVFSESAEFRWLNTNAGLGNAALLSEGELDIKAWDEADLNYLEAADNRYLIWGSALGNADGWSSLSAARIGTVEVPISATKEQSVKIVTKEYLGHREYDKYGNVEVIEERLIKLEATNGKA